MIKFHFILIFLLGILLMPASAVACGSKTSKKSCHQEVACCKSEKKECCCSDSCTSGENKGCNGDCDNSLCGCGSTSTTPTVSFISEFYFETRIFNFSTGAKVNFSNASPSISDGYSSIWLIPKIS